LSSVWKRIIEVNVRITRIAQYELRAPLGDCGGKATKADQLVPNAKQNAPRASRDICVVKMRFTVQTDEMSKPQISKIAWLLCAVVLQAVTSGAQPVTKVAAGVTHSLFLKGDGSLWAMGYNYSGQLGDGSYNQTNRPELIVASGVKAIAAGGDPRNFTGYTLFLKSDGSLWGMGNNYSGQLGDGTYSSNAPNSETNVPELIVASDVTAIAAGGGHSLILKSDGSLWAMGYNAYGQLGDGNYSGNVPHSGTNIPEQIVASDVTAIAAGGMHSLFLKSDGSLWAMGGNYFGQLGDGTYYNTNRPEQIVGSNVTAIAAGGYHSLFLKSDGSLWAMGANSCGQLGDGTYDNTNRPEQIVASGVTAIAAGGDPVRSPTLTAHSLFLKSDGSLWAMGYNGDGQLGDGTYDQTNRPELIVASGVTAIAAGGDPDDFLPSGHSMFLKSDGSLWAMGNNSYGQLGDGTYNHTSRPKQILAAYNQIAIQSLSGGAVLLPFVGVARANYALDRSLSLTPPIWMPQVTNPADSVGVLVFTNAPDPTANNFWRIRSVP
jgi:alpha-tubulin suppressor-like RCC1 family protein